MKEGQKIQVLCYDPKARQNIWKVGIFQRTVSALDREYRVNCKLKTGEQINGAAPECVRLPLKAVKVMFANPAHNYITSINPQSHEYDLKRYFIGERFNVSNYPNEIMEVCTGIQLIHE